MVRKTANVCRTFHYTMGPTQVAQNEFVGSWTGPEIKHCIALKKKKIFGVDIKNIYTDCSLEEQSIWCVVSVLAHYGCRRIIQVDAAHWWWMRRSPSQCKALWGSRKELYKCSELLLLLLVVVVVFDCNINSATVTSGSCSKYLQLIITWYIYLLS